MAVKLYNPAAPHRRSASQLLTEIEALQKALPKQVGSKRQSLTNWVSRYAMQPSKIRGVLRLQIIANRVVMAAERGQEWAIKLIWERLDGRVMGETSLVTPPTVNVQTNIQVNIDGHNKDIVSTQAIDTASVT